MISLKRFYLLSFLAYLLGSSILDAQSTLTDHPNGTTPSPYGYWESLPSAYATNPNQEFPVIIFLHGLGTNTLNQVINNGPMRLINNSGHPLNQYFDQNGVIVLSPHTGGGWWTGAVRDFLDYAFETYRIDRRRVYITGLSAGAGGIHGFMNDDPNALEVSAVAPVAIVQAINSTTGAEACSVVPYWILTAYGDSYGGAQGGGATSVNNIAGFLLGTGPTNVLATDPEAGQDVGSRQDVSASFDTNTGWTWEYGRTPTGNDNPRITLYQGSSHNSWTRTYDNQGLYDWFLAQVKPELTVTEPVNDQVYAAGEPLTFSASALDIHGGAIDGSNISWSSDIAGDLGTGETIQVPGGLTTGEHVITCKVIDNVNRGAMQYRIPVTISYAPAFTAQLDFGTSSDTTTGHWNNFFTPQGETVDSIIDDQGNSLNVSVWFPGDERFSWITTNGLDASDVHPATAQRDAFYVTSPSLARIEFGRLNPAQTYDFTFFASRRWENVETRYTVGSDSVLLNVYDNADRTATLTVTPSATGRVVLYIQGENASTGYLSALTITTAGYVGSGGGNDSESDGLDDTWETTHFGDLSQDGTGDYDGDGISNLLEFATNSSPTDDTDSGRPLPGTTTVSSDTYLCLIYHKNQNATNVTYEVERSTDLVNWSTAGTVEVSTTPATGKTDTDEITVRSTTALTGEPREFLRLKVSTP